MRVTVVGLALGAMLSVVLVALPGVAVAADPVQWAELQAPSPSDYEYFGYSVAVSGDTIVVGAPEWSYLSDELTVDDGLAYVFTRRSDNTVTLTATLTASEAHPEWDLGFSEEFGRSVAISGDTIVVGAPKTVNVIPGFNQGSVYVFTKPVGGWTDATETAELISPAPDNRDLFGSDVAVSGDTIVVKGGRASAYVFTKPVGGWATSNVAAKLTASDAVPGDFFGESVAVSGDTIVVGAPYADNGVTGSDQGAGYVFTKPVGGWVDAIENAKVAASTPSNEDRFGWAVAVSGDTVVVGAPGPETGSNTGEGAGYAFTKPAGGWATTSSAAKLTAPDAFYGDHFGSSVAVSGNMIVVGAPFADIDGFGYPSLQGAGYAFTKPADRPWATTNDAAKLTASDAAHSDLFGVSVAVADETIVVGAHYADNGGRWRGSAYVFGLVPGPVPLTFTSGAFPEATVGGAPVGLTVTVTNTGTAAATPSAITSAGDGVTVTGGSCATGTPIPPARTCTVDLAWAPTGAGALTDGSLTLAYPGDTSPADVLTLTGSATAPRPTNPTPTTRPALQTAVVRAPKKIKYKGKTVLVKKAVTTNAAQKAKATVTVKPKAKRYAKVETANTGKVTLTTAGKKNLKVILKLTAPAISGYSTYSYTKKWTVKKKPLSNRGRPAPAGSD